MQAVPAQTGPLGVADATARSLTNNAIRDARSLGVTHPFVVAVRQAYLRLPVASRGPAVSAAFAWAKNYINSPAFTAAYAATRQRAKPAGGSQYELSVDEELKKKIDNEEASLAQTRETLSLLPASERPAVLAALNEAEARLHSPELLKAFREEIVSRRSADEQGSAEAVVRWTADYPADARVFVKRELEAFLADTASVDFSLPITTFKTPAGALGGFVGPLDHGLSWIEGECLLAGRDMVSAARSAAAAWVKELAQ